MKPYLINIVHIYSKCTYVFPCFVFVAVDYCLPNGHYMSFLMVISRFITQLLGYEKPSLWHIFNIIIILKTGRSTGPIRYIQSWYTQSGPAKLQNEEEPKADPSILIMYFFQPKKKLSYINHLIRTSEDDIFIWLWREKVERRRFIYMIR